MPLTNLQTAILRLLASRRDSESLDRNPFSADIDIFHDREDRVALSAIADAELLKNTGYGLDNSTLPSEH